MENLMLRKFEAELHEKYPNLFKIDLRRPKAFQRVPCQCGSGWYGIIASACAEINNYLEKHPAKPEFKWTQIKEKFGGLRLYYDGPDAEFIRGVIRMAEATAYKTCEVCGNQGTVRKGHWIRTLCEQCHQASQNVDNPD
jgi:hypothetical protein